MIDKLMPVVSLFNLIIAGIKEAKKNNTLSNKRSIYRKILEIQLLLEDIIDNAQDILSFIKARENLDIKSKEELGELKSKIFSQKFKIHLLIDNLEDDSAFEIMRLFTPMVRRRITELIHVKGGFLSYVLYKVVALETSKGLTVNELLLDWNHNDYIEHGDEYTDTIIEKYDDGETSIFTGIEKQERTVKQLIELSEDLSLFIRENIGIEEVLRFRN